MDSTTLMETVITADPPLRVMALHALLYCERLFYLEEVEEIRRADAAVYAGRRLHDEVLPADDETPERRSVEVQSETWGLMGKVDAARKRDGAWIAYEHKRGRCHRGPRREVLAWPSDRIQAVAYAVLLEEALGQPVREARVRYHADNATAIIAVDEAARDELRRAVQRARFLRTSTQRPPVTENENLCGRCSLAPVCLPEEERLDEREHAAPTLFPRNRERQTLHVVAPKARVGRSGLALVVATDEGEHKYPVEQLDAVLIHGFGQVSTQALHLCHEHDVAVHWLTAGGRFVGGLATSCGRVQQRIRQYEALARDEVRLGLARRLVQAKVLAQLRYVLRASRGDHAIRERCVPHLARMRQVLSRIPAASSADTLLGLEGVGAKAYFACLPHLLVPAVPDELRPTGRTKHPPRDPFNAALSYGYALVQSLVYRSIVAVGLEPSLGFYHRPRTAAHPLVLDLMELFRTSLWEMPLVASLNRGQWSLANDFELRPGHVWLSEAGRKKALVLFEQRLQESHQHPHTGQALSYARMVELEARLLEKEWTGCPGLFAQWRLR